MESSQEEQEIAALALIKAISRFAEPGRDPEDDAATLRALIARAKEIMEM